VTNDPLNYQKGGHNNRYRGGFGMDKSRQNNFFGAVVGHCASIGGQYKQKPNEKMNIIRPVL